MRILLVEDNDAQLWALAAYLEGAGFTVQACSHADDALQALCSDTVDAVVTDYYLRRRRGCEIVRAAKELRIPSIVVTGEASVDELARSVNVGARYLLLKPYAPEELVERIRHAVWEASVKGRVYAYLKKIRIQRFSAGVLAAIIASETVGAELLGMLGVIVDHSLD